MFFDCRLQESVCVAYEKDAFLVIRYKVCLPRWPSCGSKINLRQGHDLLLVLLEIDNRRTYNLLFVLCRIGG